MILVLLPLTLFKITLIFFYTVCVVECQTAFNFPMPPKIVVVSIMYKFLKEKIFFYMKVWCFTLTT